MLESLDTLIALVTYLSICSLVVLVIVQMISAALSLRGKNMANALALTFNSIDSTLTAGAAQRLARKILTSPLLSDSVHTDKSPSNAGAANLVMPARVGNAVSKLESFKLANAIRPGEVYAALQKLAAGGDPDAAKLIASVAGNSPKAEEIKQKLKAIEQIVNVVVDPTVKAQVLASVSAASARIVQEIDSAKDRFEAWCQAAQDRSEQWFRTHTRGFTIAASIIFAAFCQIDGIELFKLMSTSATARAAMAKAGEKLVADGVEWMNEDGARSQALQVADTWNDGFKPDLQVPRDGIESLQQVREAARAVSAPEKIAAAKASAESARKAAGDDATKKRVAEDRASQLAELEKDFDQKFQKVELAATSAYNRRQEARVLDLKNMAEASSYPIFPSGRWWRWPGTTTWQSFCNALRHLPGIALFAGLLTLGAPYWFNLLKNLASLRPALAQLIGEEKQSRQLTSESK